MKTSWRTTLGGFLLALGQGVQATGWLGEWSQSVGTCLTLLGGVILGVSARDHNVTSEQAGLKPESKEVGP